MQNNITGDEEVLVVSSEDSMQSPAAQNVQSVQSVSSQVSRGRARSRGVGRGSRGARGVGLRRGRSATKQPERKRGPFPVKLISFRGQLAASMEGKFVKETVIFLPSHFLCEMPDVYVTLCKTITCKLFHRGW